MFNFIPHGTKFPFMSYKYPMAIFSTILTLGAFYVMLHKGFHYGVDFAGGVELVVSFPKDMNIDAEKLRTTFENMGIRDASVQTFGEDQNKTKSDFIVHFPADFANDEAERLRLEKVLAPLAPATLPAGTPLITQFRFTGLERAYLTLAADVPLESLRTAIQTSNFGMLELTSFVPFGRETSREYQLSFRGVQSKLQTDLDKALGASADRKIEIQKVDFVGAKVGKDLKNAAVLSMLITALLIFLYIFLRFDLVYAPGVVIAGIHDVAITAGIFALMGKDFDLTIIAALLTLAGYSVNDTIIVYDRIREVAGNMKGKSFSDIINIAVNQTLSRTIVTSGTVFLATIALFLWGGPVIHGFSFAFLIGIVVGTYSSVFIASPVILFMERWVRGREVTRRKKAAA